MRSNYYNGVRDGNEIEYFENGKVDLLVPYKKGAINGTMKAYYENGNLMLSVDYVDDMRHGKVNKYNKDGSLYATIDFKNDKIIKGKCMNGHVMTNEELETYFYSLYRIKCD